MGNKNLFMPPNSGGSCEHQTGNAASCDPDGTDKGHNHSEVVPLTKRFKLMALTCDGSRLHLTRRRQNSAAGRTPLTLVMLMMIIVVAIYETDYNVLR